MIQTLRYEPRGQRQRYEPREQQSTEPGQRHTHLHLHLHLHLSWRARQGRSTSLGAMRVVRICAALVGAAVMPLWLFFFAGTIQDAIPPNLSALFHLAWITLFVGLALAWCAVGALLLVLWRARPRGRFGLLLPLVLLLLIPLFLLHGLQVVPLVAFLGPLNFLLLFVVLIVHPLISALLLLYVSREARALRKVAPTHAWLSFVVVSAMALILLSGLLLNLSLMLGNPPGFLQLLLPAMCGAVLIPLSLLLGAMLTVFASLSQRQPPSSQPHPKDVSPADVDSSWELREYRG